MKSRVVPLPVPYLSVLSLSWTMRDPHMASNIKSAVNWNMLPLVRPAFLVDHAISPFDRRPDYAFSTVKRIWKIVAQNRTRWP